MIKNPATANLCAVAGLEDSSESRCLKESNICDEDSTSPAGIVSVAKIVILASLAVNIIQEYFKVPRYAKLNSLYFLNEGESRYADSI